MARHGCEKCEYTGFAYNDIPCECTEEIKAPEKTEMSIEIEDFYLPKTLD